MHQFLHPLQFGWDVSSCSYRSHEDGKLWTCSFIILVLQKVHRIKKLLKDLIKCSALHYFQRTEHGEKLWMAVQCDLTYPLAGKNRCPLHLQRGRPIQMVSGWGPSSDRKSGESNCFSLAGTFLLSHSEVTGQLLHQGNPECGFLFLLGWQVSFTYGELGSNSGFKSQLFWTWNYFFFSIKNNKRNQRPAPRNVFKFKPWWNNIHVPWKVGESNIVV